MVCSGGCHVLGAVLTVAVLVAVEPAAAFAPTATSFAAISGCHASLRATALVRRSDGLTCTGKRRRTAYFGRYKSTPFQARRDEGRKFPNPLRATPDTGPSDVDSGGGTSAGLAKKWKKYPGAVYKFTRPHTIRGTILASVTGVARCLLETPTTISMKLVPRALLGMLALLLGNAYIVGINQIYDVDIDKINKPELPVASGEMSKRLAWGLVLASVTTGPYIVHRAFSPLIFRLYAFGLTIGGLYSVPPFQFKRFPVAAGAIIACVRGFLLNFGVYYAVREALGLPFKWNPAVLFLARFMTVFAAIIAVTKDLPDVKGDRKYKISTFASKRGVKFTARAACVVLGLNYVSAIAQGILSPAGAFNRKVMVGGHTLLLALMASSLRALNPESQDSIKGFYKRIWDLFYLEYAMYPFI